MRYVKLGTTGLDVSPIAIGAMTYGDPNRGHPMWSLDEEASRPLIKHALDAGINFFDTANMYSQGSSEEILGRALKDFANRDEIVIATKVRHPMRGGPNGICAYGSGLLSSYGELQHAIESDEVQRYPLQLEWVINQGAEIDHYQPLLFIVDSFDHLFDMVDRLEKWMIEGKLFHVAPGLPEVNPGDLHSFMEAGKLA